MEVNERVARPFKSLHELYSEINSLPHWHGIVDLRKSTDFVYKAVEIDAQFDRPTKLQKEDVPKTIMCHDLMGGYLQDKYIDGSNQYNSYHFYHWSIIDIFIYFSHYFITIPPYGWINAAHKHGVKVLGTIITESAEGKDIWTQILKTKENILKFADSLIHLAQFYKFEGWLLNIENEINEHDIRNLVFFVQYLTVNMHIKIKNSEIIWYDSVTNEGKLKWQNELNEKNECFFDVCDGIFLNYTWSDSSLIKSTINAQRKNRVRDIYTGLDVWGRGCPGGGGFNSAHALHRIRAQGLSVAIFAPAWTFEFFGSKTFPRIENIFWAQLLEFLYIHVPVYENESFITSFCRGVGMKYYEYGRQITYQDQTTHDVIKKNSSFYNIGMQKHQIVATCPHLKFILMKIVHPLKKDDASKPEPQECIYETSHEILKILGNKVTIEDKPNSFAGINCKQYSYDISYEGGGCLQLLNNNIRSYHRLFYVNVKFSKEIQVRIIYQDYTEESNNQSSLILLLGDNIGIVSFLPRETLQYGLGWKMSIFHTNLKTVDEIGIALKHVGNCYIGKIVLEEIKHPWSV